jgi:hypothetical protein
MPKTQNRPCSCGWHIGPCYPRHSQFSPRFYLRRADGKEAFVSSHQPDARLGGKRDSPEELLAAVKPILAQPVWQQWLQGRAVTLIVVNAFYASERMELAIK